MGDAGCEKSLQVICKFGVFEKTGFAVALPPVWRGRRNVEIPRLTIYAQAHEAQLQSEVEMSS
jgi:hypothetical protein